MPHADPPGALPPILFCCPGFEPGPWAQALQARLPGARLLNWTPGLPPVDGYALVWMPPQRFIDEQPRLLGLFNAAAGVDALLKLRLPPELPIVRLEDAGMGLQMAEYVCHAVVRHFRRFEQLEAQQRAGVWQQPPAPDRAAYAVGVMGAGVLGRQVVAALRAFEFPVHTWTRTAPQALPSGVTSHVGPDGLEPFLRSVQTVACLLPLTPETENLLDRRRLSWLPRGAQVVNVARGAHVVDEDLIALLDEGHLDRATLDVFREEPLPPQHPFWTHPRIHLTPHTSARTLRGSAVEQIVYKMAQVLSGQPWSALGGLVDRARGY